MPTYPILDLPGTRIPENREPLGSKEKVWLRDDAGGEPRLLFKYNRPHTGEDWSEKIAAELAGLLGLPHARVELATYDRKPGAALFDFTDNTRLPLVHGNELLATINPEYPSQQTYRTREHTVEAVFDALKRLNVAVPESPEPMPLGLNDASDVFVGYLLLDAWIGNTDRHHENWGLLWDRTKNPRPFSLAPSYDHASSLGRELSDEKRTRNVNTRHGPPWERYASKAKSAFYPDEKGNEPLRTWEAFRRAASIRPQAGSTWVNRLKQVSEDEVEAAVHAVPESRMSLPAKMFACRLLTCNAKLVGE